MGKGGEDADAAAWKAQEAAASEAKKAAEKAQVEEENLKRQQELEKSGKKVSGGMHKFDSSEVDVEGGDATTDDFLDAFGFGGTDGDAATDGSAEEAAEAAFPVAEVVAETLECDESQGSKAG